MQTNLLFLACFRKVFITLSFAIDPSTLNKPLNASRLARFQKKNIKNVNQPNSFSKFIFVVCNVRYNAWEEYLWDKKL